MDKNAYKPIKIRVVKAEGTARGDGWYFLVNGIKEGLPMVDVGGDDYYRSEREAKAAAREFIESCYYHSVYGWCAR